MKGKLIIILPKKDPRFIGGTGCIPIRGYYPTKMGQVNFRGDLAHTAPLIIDAIVVLPNHHP